jgi:hypothetical protein
VPERMTGLTHMGRQAERIANALERIADALEATRITYHEQNYDMTEVKR